ncbi:hypothetical protein CYQ88_06990 [Hydrogenovibrio sp. SC-1]|uniref:methyl-accepting chemotaxis protein n=1 Tax=Hydrogenovibrio sp. SC-1 TaxID=2065820 RepID=UPI000C7AA222|nr:methyl-accepting chemotaxis protein [Hydrogenovibrio sp. SC-1]PLA74259.1 hypothetical protein CYQ88_06990 [Hydrogenovibrio sp. SC-1]
MSRIDRPVVNETVPIPDHYRIISRTDLNGTIIEANSEFIEISGYARDEIIGQPHNILRHPDVPKAVFKDLWQTLQAGKSWTQIVKNRTKDGRHYWVKANAAPITENGKITGYISVRKPASSAEIQLASQAYKDINTGKLKIVHGQISKSGAGKLHQLNPFYNLNLMPKMITYNIFALVLLTAISAIFLQQNINEALHITLAMAILTVLNLISVRLNVINPIKTITKTITQTEQTGDLSYRIDNTLTGEPGELAEAYNALLQNAQVALGESGRMLKELSRGKLDSSSVIPFKGDFRVMEVNLQEAASTLTSTLNDINRLLSSISHGQFHEKPMITPHGEFKVAINNVESTTDTLQGVFTEINTLMNQVAEGFFSQRISADLEGEFDQLKRNINNSLNKLESVIEETTQVMIAQGAGDLKPRIHADTSGTLAVLKEGINNSVNNISSLLSQSNYSIRKLSDGTITIAQDVSDLSGRTQQQAASLEETAASMEQITSTIQQTANNAKDANEAANESLKEAQEANLVVHKTIESINEINEASAKISEITALIDSIAFQTNLLALNAAVEAARAGDHGRGFAVVAGEVRSLAAKSADAAKDIRQLIDNTVEKVHEGARLADESGRALELINDSIAKIGSYVSEISQTSSEQAKGVEQVNIAISSIDQVTQQNSALVDETAQRTEEMSRLAEEVNTVISNFKMDIHDLGFETAMQTGNFIFANARRAHLQWKGTVLGYVEGLNVEFSREVATDHTKCALGKWFYGPEGQQYADLAEMQTLDKWHAEVHATIKRILDAHEMSDLDTVRAEFRNLDDASDKVVDSLTRLEQTLAQQAAHQQAPAAPKPLAQKTAKPSSAHLTAPTKKTQAATPNKPSSHQEDEWGEF